MRSNLLYQFLPGLASEIAQIMSIGWRRYGGVGRVEKASLVDEGRYDIVASILTPFVYYEYYMLKVNHAGKSGAL